ncbi:hypothetical protein P9D28_07775 [Bacillus haynesii]|uniref:hypothetical protein n=1 Tax=Bacillus haynesii TaxID=1925021 RepID=UPI002DBA84AF|nr:hypothetical protein [Bacillus haynesii]MEC1552326.1 hypothetical protein [Bacillus haynesii]
MNNPNFWQPIITAFGTLLGACLGGYLTHFFYNRRENSAVNRKIYENLFSPILFKIFSYYEYNSLFNQGMIKDNYIHWLEDIYFHTRNNLIFATPKIVSTCESIERLKFMEDRKGTLKDERLLILVEELLNLALKLLNDKDSKEEIKKYRALYFIWRILTERYGSSEEVMGGIRMTFVLDNIKINPNKYKKAYRYYSKNFYKKNWEEVIEITLNKIGVKKKDLSIVMNHFNDCSYNNNFGC